MSRVKLEGDKLKMNMKEFSGLLEMFTHHTVIVVGVL